MGKAHVGGGPYEAELLAAREACGAEGVVLLVKGGERGDAFEIGLDADGIRELPRVLRELAAQIERIPLCPKHGPFQPTQGGACPACWRGE